MGEKTELGETEGQHLGDAMVVNVTTNCLDLQCGPDTFECLIRNRLRGKCMFEDQKMNRSLSREKKQAQRTATSE
eukprot:11998241-Karenia_brevis.AAC.1